MHLTLLKLRCQQGFTTITLMGVLAVGGLLIAAGFAAVDPDISLSREDQDYKQAYGAAESGLQWYLNSLGTDNNYYTLCSSGLPQPSPGQAAPVNPKWDTGGLDPRIWRNLPGESARYTVELLPAPGYTQCVPGNQYSMVDPNGNMRLRVTGRSRGETRSVLATLRRRNFIDFVYFTDYETLDPAAYSNPVTAESNCARYRAGRVGRGCTEIRFIDTDDQLGPVHTNDNFLICGTPQFGRTRRDRVEASNGTSPWSFDCASTPDVRGTLQHPAAALGMPPSNREIANVALPAYKFRGKTIIELQGTNMLVTNRVLWPDGLPRTMALPPNGVIWAEATTGTCTSTFDRTQDYSDPRLPCGDIWLKGNYTRDLTVAADGDIVINGHLERSSGADGLLLGLIANNFVRVYHPTYTDDDCATNDAGSISDLRIQAAILALKHSFIVDNWNCGTPLGALHVEGAIAQKFRGPVGTGSGGSISTGYRKDYVYNDRLRYREPPFFMDPVQASWRVARQNEQVPLGCAVTGRATRCA